MTLRAWCSGFPYPSPPLNHGSITPLQVPQRPIPSYSMQRHMLFWRLNWNFIYTRISDAEGSWTWSVESMHGGGIAWLGVEVVRRIILKQRMWAVFNHPSLLFLLVQGFLVWSRYGYNLKEVITCEVSFDIFWFDRDSYEALRIGSGSVLVLSCLINIYENTWYISSTFSLIPSFQKADGR